ncbi:MAG TPA: BatA domain-containing protein [Anaeromyxobacteraceae bacterium]|nr:BatA domain-containing protein [Anaeromyxobacteraceae bacterium]
MNLGFVHPALAWGALAALLPLLVHLFFRRRPRPVSFPAVEFILRARRETQRRLRLRRILLFAARTALLLLVALALARPELRREGGGTVAATTGPAAVALVLDASASMTYRRGDEPLFERARADLGDAIGALGSSDAATLIVCGGPAPSAPAPSYDRAALRRALRDARPTMSYADVGACLGAAAVALSDPAVATLAKRIVVATDLAATSWRLGGPPPEVNGPKGPQRPEVRVVDAARGSELPNRAVVDLAAEPDLASGPRGYRVTATLANASAEPVNDVRIELRTSAAPTAPVAVQGFVEIPAGGTAKKTLVASFEKGGPASVSVALAPDALALDDARVLAVAVPRDAKALVVDGSPSPVKFRDEAFFLEAALQSSASPVRTTLVDVGGLAQHRFADFDVVFLLNVRELGPRAVELRSFVEQGGGLFVALGSEVDFELADKELAGLVPPLHVVKTATDTGGPARFDAVDFSHPALAIFASGDAREGLLGARTYKYALIRPERRGEGARTLASFDDGAPALVETHPGRGRVILFTSSVDRDWSDWSIRTSFLPAMQRFAAYLAGVEERRVVSSVVGATRTVELEQGQTLKALVAPDGRELAADSLPRPGPPGSPPVVVPDAPGLWEVRVESRGEVRLDPALAFAVFPDPRESDTRRVAPAELTAWLGGADHAALAQDARGERRIPLWSVLLALALAAFVAESALAAR